MNKKIIDLICLFIPKDILKKIYRKLFRKSLYKQKYTIEMNHDYGMRSTIKEIIPLFVKNDSDLPCDFTYLFNILSDMESKFNLCKVAEFYANYREGREKHLIDPIAFDENFKMVHDLFKKELSARNEYISSLSKMPIYKLDLNKLGINAIIYGNEFHVLVEAIYNQYEYRDVKFEKDDFVLDCGAFSGDVSVIIASKIGENGKVFSFEGVPENIILFNEMVKINPTYRNNLELVNKFVSDKNETVPLINSGPSSRMPLSNYDGGNSKITNVETITIDDFVKTKNLNKLDFIKMDIEGAELSALKGATGTIIRFKPKLAICVYHRETDIYDIPKFINDLNLGYKFYLRPNYIDKLEIVLYAKAN